MRRIDHYEEAESCIISVWKERELGGEESPVIVMLLGLAQAHATLATASKEVGG